MKSIQRTVVPLLLIAASLGLAGCSRDKAGDADSAPVADSVAEGDNVVADEPELPKANFWKPMAQLLAGDYSAACTHVTATGGKPRNVSASVTADGSYKFNDYSGDMFKSSSVVIMRRRDDDGSTNLMLAATEEDTMFGLHTGPAGQGSVLQYGKKDIGTYSCEPGKQPIALAAKPLHVSYASFLERPSLKIGCILPGDITRTYVDFLVKNGVFNIGKYTYDLGKMSETLTIEKGFGTLHYMAASADQKDMVSVAFDEFGAVMLVTRQHDGESMVMCTNKD